MQLSSGSNALLTVEAHAASMKLRRRRPLPWSPDPGKLAIVRVLLLLQVGFALLSALGSALISLFTGFGLLLLPMIAVTAGGATLLLVLIGRLERGSRRARRLVVWGEASVLLFAVVDLALAIGLAHAPLDLGPVLTRFVLPLAVIRLLRREREPRPVTPDVVKAAA